MKFFQLMKFLAVCATVCLLIVAFSGCAFDEAPASDEFSEESAIQSSGFETDSGNAITPDCDNLVEGEGFPSIYPHAWQGMDAVIVKWGNKTGQVYNETLGGGVTGREPYRVNYIGVEVEFLKVFAETMTKSTVPNIENIISQTTYIVIPEIYASEIEPGDCSLVFLEWMYNKITQDEQNAPDSKCEIVLGAKLGEQLTESTFVDAPIFRIEDSRIVVPDGFYAIEESTEEYRMLLMNYLCAANEFLTEQQNTADLFADGMSLESLARFFRLICS